MNVIRRRGWEIPASQITPEHLSFSRRGLMAGARGAGADAGHGAGATRQPTSPTCPTRPPTFIRPSANEKYVLDRAITDEKVNTNYNNFYEFGTSKNVTSAGAGAAASGRGP